jgi:hypothetical protein
MTRTHSVALVALVTSALVVAALVQPLLASPPNPASGTLITVPPGVTLDSRSADGNLFEERIANRVISGTFSGPIVSHVFRVTHKDGDRNFHGVSICSPCVVEGKIGAVTYKSAGTTVAGITEVQLVIIQATDQLEGLHGVLHVEGEIYSGRYHFDPAS